MTEYYLWLLQVMGAANPRSVQLIRHYGSPRAVYEAFGRLRNNIKFLKENELAGLKTASLEKSREILKICEDFKYRAVTLADGDYPVALKNIYNPPILIFAAGELPKEERLAIAVVGTREACDYSVKVAEHICGKLAKEGVTIVSGMAVGIDKTAHTAALKAGGRTIGVLACGFGVDYPRNSALFRQQIINAGGAVITELLPNGRSERGYFNYRNRIMSGISRGVLIVEAAEKSGCHITAAHALNQNRDLFCVPPPNIFGQRFKGVIGYLRDGAIPVFDHSDILNEYLINPIVYDEDEEKEELISSDSAFENDKPKIVKRAAAKPLIFIPEKPPEPNLTEITGEARIIAELLKDGAKTVDFLSEKSGFSANELSELLLELEIDGVIESAAGSSYRICI